MIRSIIINSSEPLSFHSRVYSQNETSAILIGGDAATTIQYQFQ